MLRLSKHVRPKLRLAAGTAAIAMLSVSPVPALAKKEPKPSGFEPTLPVVAPVAPVAASGSIFAASGGYAALYQGTRAARVGDPLTILLVESTTASKAVSSKSGKSGSLGVQPPTKGLISKLLDAEALKAGSNSSFTGQGSAAQTSSLNSTLSVTIAEVRPNGTALVRGEKKMLISQGDEWVRFSGIVRLVDIDQENQIASDRVADARIEYTGKGALQQASKQGWLGRFFNMISPF
ncbi:flagellar basal body L-ring protein FlgH [Novosphingobium guangzhouense]|uniref:flagellar basal body L-ring protein FlgH n=1 Tax=Novosphingobium guangzhouense TaxID=1850347 RepID=UPI000CCC5BCB|nr:flagellar basal body L-ring protein FlgH [Novosphingobium guangzhouense]